MASKPYTIRLTDESLKLIGDDEKMSPRVNQVFERYAWLLDEHEPLLRDYLELETWDTLLAAARNVVWPLRCSPYERLCLLTKSLDPEQARIVLLLDPIDVVVLLEALEFEITIEPETGGWAK